MRVECYIYILDEHTKTIIDLFGPVTPEESEEILDSLEPDSYEDEYYIDCYKEYFHESSNSRPL